MRRSSVEGKAVPRFRTFETVGAPGRGGWQGAGPRGQAVLSTGSIAWCGSLSHNGYANNVARITANVLRRFIDPTPFV
jgi:hypothetical protein